MKVFISYAWTSEDYSNEVLNLAERLTSDGVHVVIDKWDLLAGNDKNTFMEKMVQDESIDHVLMLLNKEYKVKSDSSAGGVGTEAQIIRSELYEKVNQTKFIPVLTELDENGNPFLPHYLKARIYIDLATPSIYEDKYEELLRLIYKRPEHSRPKLGTPPEWLFEDKENTSTLIYKEKILINAIEHNKNNSNLKCKEYLDEINSELNKFYVTDNFTYLEDLGKACLNKFYEMRYIRDSLIRTLQVISVTQEKKVFDSFF